MSGLKVYNNLKLCPIFNFFESRQDVRYLMILENYNDLPFVEDLSLLNEIKYQLYEDYNSLDNSDNDLFIDNKAVAFLNYKKMIIQNSLYLLNYKYCGFNIDFSQTEEHLNRLGYDVTSNTEEELEEKINAAMQKLKGIDNQIKIKTNSIGKKVDDASFNSTDYMEIVAVIQSVGGIKLDIYRDSVAYFISSKKITTEKMQNAN